MVCGYHGLVFNAAGRCTYMPAQKTINPSACVRAYPVVERHRLVWLWPGDPALADPAKMPDFHWNDGTEWVGEGGTFYSLKCDYRLVIDNLMDLTHETYVHAGSIGDEAITGTPFEVTHTDRTATVTRWMIDIEPPPFWAQPARQARPCRPLADHPFPGAGAWSSATSAWRSTGTGAPQGDRSQGVNGSFLAAHHAGDRDELPLLLELRPHLQDATTRSSPAIFSARMSTTARASTTRTTSCWRRSRRAIDKNPRMPFYNLNIDAGALGRAG